MKAKSILTIVLFYFVLHFSISAENLQVSISDVHDNKEIARKVSSAIVGIRAVVVKEVQTFSGKEKQLFHYYGTGVIISEDGMVLTNITVVPESPYLITLFLSDGRIVPAKYVTSSTLLETTLVKAEGSGFPYLALSNSNDAKIGDRVYTFANPFHSIENDTQVAISKGIISGIYRVSENVEEESTYRRVVIETSAALNPGSDGGPLVNHKGEVLGILSLAMQKERRLGTAIPIHMITAEIPEMSKFSLQEYTYKNFDGEQTIAQKAVEKSEAVVSVEIERNKKNKQNKKKQTKEEIMEYPDAWVSGIVVDEGKYVLTSAYSIVHNNRIKNIWVYSGKQKIKANLISLHLPYDLALLQLDTPIKNYFELEDEQLELADWIGICGKMKSSENITLNTGIVSTVKRNYNLIHVYQTQAFINYANLGGAIFDEEGKLVGIATHVDPEVIWGLNSGVSIFTSTKMIREVLPEMKKGKTTEYAETPFLGVSFWDEKKTPQGALISTITMGSAAYKAGVLPGDILISIDNTLVGEWADLVRLITSKEIGQKIQFEIVRSGETIKLEAVLGPRPH